MLEVVFCENTKKNLKRAKRNIAKSRGDVLRKITDQIIVIDLQLDQGNISDNGLGNVRLEFLKQKRDHYLFREELDFGEKSFNESMQSIEIIKSSLRNDEIVRIWYGENSEEFCGFCWLISLIKSWNINRGKVLYVKLPKYVFSTKGEYKKYYGSGSFDIEELSKYSLNIELLTDSFSQMHIDIWKNALSENSHLRIYMNGNLLNVREDFFDSVILDEASKLDEVFQGASLVSNLIGTIELDEVFFGQRIDYLISSGKFSVIKECEKTVPFFRKTLKKIE